MSQYLPSSFYVFILALQLIRHRGQHVAPDFVIVIQPLLMRCSLIRGWMGWKMGKDLIKYIGYFFGAQDDLKVPKPILKLWTSRSVGIDA